MTSLQPQFEATYRNIAPMVYAKALRLLGRPEDAAEALQEVAMKLLQNYSLYLAHERQVGWLYRVTTNVCLNMLRTHQRKDLRSATDPDLQPANLGGEDGHITRYDVTQTLTKLPAKLQSYFVYTYVDGMTQDEIAEATGEARITVARGLRKLNERLGAMYATA